tara:strand:- start:3631 stop:3885 length:255 start_codon:yes stop_codon:yes gene_type:complete
MGYWTTTIREIPDGCEDDHLAGRFYLSMTERCYEDGLITDVDEPAVSYGKWFFTVAEAKEFADQHGIGVHPPPRDTTVEHLKKE